jgi:RNA polymerase sigma-70 factor, ECF subfamily
LGSSKSAGAVGEAVPALSSQVFSGEHRSENADRLVCLIAKVSRFPVHAAHSISPTGHRRSNRTALKRTPSPLTPLLTPSHTIVPEHDYRPPSPVLHCLPLTNTRGKLLRFDSFDEAYVERLRAGDFRTQEHFRVYFTALIQVKLRSRLRSREAIEDVRQETFARFYVALREGKIVHPERLGSFVNSICNNVLLEYYRTAARHGARSDKDDDEPRELPSPVLDPLAVFTAQEVQQRVREILDQLPERDRRLLREVFLEERDKDEVCRDFGVDREYLRVLLYRAKQLFKAFYLKNNDAPESTPAC